MCLLLNARTMCSKETNRARRPSRGGNYSAEMFINIVGHSSASEAGEPQMRGNSRSALCSDPIKWFPQRLFSSGSVVNRQISRCTSRSTLVFCGTRVQVSFWILQLAPKTMFRRKFILFHGQVLTVIVHSQRTSFNCIDVNSTEI